MRSPTQRTGQSPSGRFACPKRRVARPPDPNPSLPVASLPLLRPKDAERIASAFPSESFYVPPLEVIRGELEGNGGQFNVIDLASGLKADIYVAGTDPLIAYGFAHAAPENAGKVTLNLAPATYVVAMKLRFYGLSKQEKHLRDIRSVLAVSPEAVDFQEVSNWAQRFGVAEVWKRCQERRERSSSPGQIQRFGPQSARERFPAHKRRRFGQQQAVVAQQRTNNGFRTEPTRI